MSNYTIFKHNYFLGSVKKGGTKYGGAGKSGGTKYGGKNGGTKYGGTKYGPNVGGKNGGKNGKNGPGATGVTELLAEEESESITVLFNFTVKVYAVPFVRVVTDIGEVELVPVILPGKEVAV